MLQAFYFLLVLFAEQGCQSSLQLLRQRLLRLPFLCFPWLVSPILLGPLPTLFLNSFLCRANQPLPHTSAVLQLNSFPFLSFLNALITPSLSYTLYYWLYSHFILLRPLLY